MKPGFQIKQSDFQLVFYIKRFDEGHLFTYRLPLIPNSNTDIS
jgi:hypothetical protein